MWGRQERMGGVVTRCPDAGLHPTAQMSLPMARIHTRRGREHTACAQSTTAMCKEEKEKGVPEFTRAQLFMV